jgi:hypothetical protein
MNFPIGDFDIQKLASSMIQLCGQNDFTGFVVVFRDHSQTKFATLEGNFPGSRQDDIELIRKNIDDTVKMLFSRAKLPFDTFTSAEQSQVFAIAFNKLANMNFVMNFTGMQLFVIASQIQLATRNEGNKGPSSLIAKDIARDIINDLGRIEPDMVEVMEKGWHPDFDVL